MTGDVEQLPLPDSAEIQGSFSNRETREAYRFLYERRLSPPTMAEWIARAENVLGKANVHTSRRLRDVRDHFEVRSTKVGSDWVYELVGRRTTPVAKGGPRISPRLEAEVYTVKGRFCHMCGATPEDGAKLQIDHIIPRSWGGETSLENLEPLCAVHNNGKRNFFASFSPYADAIKLAIGQATPWERIGELLRSSRELGIWVPSELLPVVGRESHKGDPARRLRDLRVVLGWTIKAHKRKEGRGTKVEYELIADRPWPPEGAQEAVTRYERERKRRKAAGPLAT
ncbi:HNH endonuclease [Cellulomonas sp. Root137]|uniref:HNH endonuclease n=1 Tax=Cellulomonas sp. Root137 TaxID=1736459 RepID=UPI0006F2EA95|nr:HNH endonuclease signature motif containing protein [Cellulomonas sp. Root137]KQY41876.1 HNH endonuclease [Cellulomonas sp. Root137]